MELRLTSRRGQDEKQLVEALRGNAFLWSSDGKLLLVQGVGGTESAYVIDPDNLLYWPWDVCGAGPIPQPMRWAADGRGVFFFGGKDPRPYEAEEILRCDFSGKLSTVTTFTGRGIDAAWISPDERKVVYDGNTRLLVAEIPDGQPGDGLAPARLDDRFSFWSPDSRWIGALAQVKPSAQPRPLELVIKNIVTGRLKSFGYRAAMNVQWWAPQPPVAFDTREIVRAALGQGKPFKPPLKLKPRP